MLHHSPKIVTVSRFSYEKRQFHDDFSNIISSIMQVALFTREVLIDAGMVL